MNIVYIDGQYLPKSEASISVDDRGFLFGDGVYEVTPAYHGSFFRIEHHLDRIRRGLGELRIDYDPDHLLGIHDRLLADNGLAGDPAAIVYVQVTRGAAPRAHPFPRPELGVKPTVYGFASPYVRPSAGEGFSAVTVPDRRWARVDIKTTNLLPNCLAQQAALDAGADDAILVRDGIAIEGAHSNFFGVVNGRVITHPESNAILPGITRRTVLELCEELGIPVDLRPLHVEELAAADEAFFTGTTTEVRPTVRIDGRPLGNGTPGPITTALFNAYRELTDVGLPAVSGVGPNATG